jgi:hypothetical protein
MKFLRWDDHATGRKHSVTKEESHKNVRKLYCMYGILLPFGSVWDTICGKFSLWLNSFTQILFPYKEFHFIAVYTQLIKHSITNFWYAKSVNNKM